MFFSSILVSILVHLMINFARILCKKPNIPSLLRCKNNILTDMSSRNKKLKHYIFPTLLELS